MYRGFLNRHYLMAITERLSHKYGQQMANNFVAQNVSNCCSKVCNSGNKKAARAKKNCTKREGVGEGDRERERERESDVSSLSLCVTFCHTHIHSYIRIFNAPRPGKLPIKLSQRYLRNFFAWLASNPNSQLSRAPDHPYQGILRFM